MNITITQVTTKEFQKYFNRLPINYKSKAGIEYITFITTEEIFSQLFMTYEIPEFGKILKSTDRSGNNCRMMFRKLNDPNNEFKMMISIFNTKTGERIALMAV